MFIKKVDQVNIRNLLSYKRQKLGQIVNTMTGHCLKKHISVITKTGSKLCRACNEVEETVQHVVCCCPALLQTRVKYFGKFLLESTDIHNLKPEDVALFIEKTVGFKLN